MEPKPTPIEHQIIDSLRNRWSPRAFVPARLSDGTLQRLLEAARWAPSCFNAQPWRFVAAERGDPGFDAILAGLNDKNQVWARSAGALIVGVRVEAFEHNGKPNGWAAHDLGAASFSIVLQAAELGLGAHQMAGFSSDELRSACGIGDGYEPAVVIAVGQPGPAALLDEQLAAREVAARTRKPQADIAFGARLGERLVDPRAERIDEVLNFWFGELDEHGLCTEETSKKWWTKSADFDDEVRRRFEGVYDDAVAGRLDSWLSSARGRLAYIVVLDQFSRNMFRDTAKMYAADALAVDASLSGIELGLDRGLAPAERVFFYMPTMHSEVLEVQDCCVELFESLEQVVGPEAKETIKNNTDYAVRHRDIVARWGRFPHRNAILGRDTSDAEAEFLKQPGSGF